MYVNFYEERPGQWKSEMIENGVVKWTSRKAKRSAAEYRGDQEFLNLNLGQYVYREIPFGFLTYEAGAQETRGNWIAELKEFDATAEGATLDEALEKLYSKVNSQMYRQKMTRLPEPKTAMRAGENPFYIKIGLKYHP